MAGEPLAQYIEAESAPAPQPDRHVASLFTLFHQVQKQNWLVEGPHFKEFHEFMKETCTMTHNQVDQRAERITALGGIPTCHPAEQVKPAYIKHEAEGTYRVGNMFAPDLSQMGEIAQQTRKTIAVEAEHHDFGILHLLKWILPESEDQPRHLEHYPSFDSLEIGLEDSDREIAAERMAS